MAGTSEDLSEVTNALHRFAAAMEQLSARYDAVQRANRRLWVTLTILTLSLLGGAAYLALIPVTQLLHQALAPKLATLDPKRAAAERQRLLEILPDDERQRVALFKRHIDWIRQYINASPDFDAGAALTYFLADMSGSVAVMPEMYAQVRAMNDEMRAIDAEMQSMNATMRALPVMAAGMDSTMGRAGRMLPTMPWNW
jgi:prefoldin subunit 5